MIRKTIQSHTKKDIKELVKKCPYDKNVWIYEQSEDMQYRFLLGKKKRDTSKLLLCCGVNPSIASLENLDPTMKRVETLVEKKGYDGYIMINLYPFRATNPKDMPEEMDQAIVDLNLAYLERCLNIFHGEIHIWAAWGNLIETKPYLKECLQQMVLRTKNYPCSWYHMGALTKKNHPRHPLYLKCDADMERFDIESYILKFD